MLAILINLCKYLSETTAHLQANSEIQHRSWSEETHMILPVIMANYKNDTNTPKIDQQLTFSQ